MKVLVVDDVGYVRHYLAQLLGGVGHGVITAASAVEGLELLQRHCLDAVITDLLMPGLNGVEFLQAARRLERYREGSDERCPPFILITALRPRSTIRNEDERLLDRAVRSGFHLVMFKPVDAPLLLRTLHELSVEPPPQKATAKIVAPAPQVSGGEIDRQLRRDMHDLGQRIQRQVEELLLRQEQVVNQLSKLERRQQALSARLLSDGDAEI